MSVISIASVLITEKAAFIMLPFLSQNITYTTSALTADDAYGPLHTSAFKVKSGFLPVLLIIYLIPLWSPL